jgi:hypothetical protein
LEEREREREKERERKRERERRHLQLLRPDERIGKDILHLRIEGFRFRV